jgi:hypothetical protein
VRASLDLPPRARTVTIRAIDDAGNVSAPAVVRIRR